MDTNNNIDPLVCQIPLPIQTTLAGIARNLQVLPQLPYSRSIGALPEADRPPPHVREAVAILDCWLDVATEEGWIDEVHESRRLIARHGEQVTALHAPFRSPRERSEPSRTKAFSAQPP